MSLILDALRKSEAERRRGDAPDLFAPMPAARHPARSRPAIAPMLAIAAAVVLTAAAWWWAHRAPSATVSKPRVAPIAPVATAPTGPPADAPLAARPAASSPLARPTRATAVPVAAAAPPRPTPPPSPAPAAMPESSSPFATTPADGPVPSSAPESQERSAALAGDADRLLRLGELAAARRANLPPLKLSMHVWDENPDHRFAIIDGQRVIEGSELGGTLVHEIRRDGVVLTIDGRDYLLPR